MSKTKSPLLKIVGAPLFVQFLVAAVSLLLWEMLSAFRILNPFFFSAPSMIFVQLLGYLGSERLYFHIFITLQEALVGLAVGTLLGVGIAELVGNIPFMGRVVDPYMMILNAIPKTALAPIMIVWFGLGLASKIALVVALTFFCLFFNTYTGVRTVDPALINVSQVLGAKRRDLIFKVHIPHSFPYILAGFKVAVGLSFIGAIIGEFLAANEGLGYVISREAGVYNMAGVFAALFVLTMTVAVFTVAVAELEKRTLRWYQ